LDYRLQLTDSNVPGLRTRTRSVSVINQWNTDGRPVRLGLFFAQNLTFLNNSTLSSNLRYFPPRVDDRLSRGNGTFTIPPRWGVDGTWRSDSARPVSVFATLNSTEEDIG